MAEQEVPSPCAAPGAAPSPDGAAEAAAVLLVEGEPATVTGWTGEAERLLGYRASEAVGRPLSAFVTGAEPGAVRLVGPGAGPGAGSAVTRGAGPQETRAEPPVAGAGVLAARHRDGRAVRLRGRSLPLDGADGDRWMVLLGEERTGPEDDAEEGAAEEAEEYAAAAADAFPLGPLGRILLENSPVALAIWDTDLRCRWLNTTVDHERSPFRNRRIGAPVREALHGVDPDLVEAVMRQVLRDGKPVIDHEFRWFTDGSENEQVTSSSLFRLENADGAPIGVCTFSVDITRSRGRERLALISDIGLRIGTTLDVVTTAQELADATVPALADFVTVDLAEAVSLGGEPLRHLRPRSTYIPAFRRAGAASLNEGTPEAAYAVGDPVYVPERSPLLEVLRTGEPFYAPVMRTSSHTSVVSDPARAERVDSFAMHSMIVLPLEARRTILGVAVFIRTGDRPPFTPDDLELARELAVRAALHLDNARRYTRERKAALALQRNMLPRSLRGGGAVEVAAEYVPAEGDEAVGGDWFDAIPLPGGRVGLVVGDVVGHGVEAAASMGRLRTAADALALLDLPPAEVLASFDRAAVTLSAENRGAAEGLGVDGCARPVFGATCLYGEYDPAAGLLTFSCAGHPPPLLIAPDGGVRQPDLPAGTPIGLGEGGYQEVAVPVAPGTVVAMYTDGLVRARPGDRGDGVEHLAGRLARPADDLGALCQDVARSLAGPSPQDDAVLLVARIGARGPDAVS
ncbi:SpoIIE family protein phosphatase [Streptomyces fuscigenes]|uniref:SpoIIE family protein phosphatase n=1 Tax=Streptomyces fuscigenes TaxID=1528880 RepID=UPI001F37D712|nr:SpoIIE family protein phosphatase [Streptomyces fuscigenes]MCF3961897.1 SpoIIE family protein phosphatase [Streptomyces fuscigenes]